jgi:hypothetical protein
MPRPCVVCCSSENIRIVAEGVARGDTDQAIADRLGMPGNTGRMRIARHRVGHIVAPAAALAKVAAKGKDVAEKRKATLEAAERGDDIAAFVGLDEITRDVRKVSKRLGRAAKATEAAGQFTAMTGVVGQQHKNLELRGRLGAHPGFVPQKLTPGEGDRPQFNLIINMPDGKTERLATIVEAPTANLPDAPSIDLPRLDFHVETNDAPVPDVPIGGASAEARRLGRLFAPRG